MTTTRYLVQVNPTIDLNLKKTALGPLLDEVIDSYVEAYSKQEVANHLFRKARLLDPTKTLVGPALPPLPRTPVAQFSVPLKPAFKDYGPPITVKNRQDFFAATANPGFIRPNPIPLVVQNLLAPWTQGYVWQDKDGDFWEFQKSTQKWHTLNKLDGNRPQIYGIENPKTSSPFTRQAKTGTYNHARTFRHATRG